MLKKIISIILATCLGLVCLTACDKSDKNIKIGVSLGVGAATRWEKEKVFMEEKAASMGITIDVRLNRTDESTTTQVEDCISLIDSGINVLILALRDATDADAVLAYAKKHEVEVISYSRVISDDSISLFVGYDSYRIGQKMGQYLTETVHSGDYIVLRGDESDSNAKLIYDGAMYYIKPLTDTINIIADQAVANWEPETAKTIVRDAIVKNNNKIDAILAPNDKIAGACIEVVKELKLENHVVITGMDTELAAVKRIVAGEQDMTICMDLKRLAQTAITEAVKLAKGEKLTINADFEISSGKTINSNLVPGLTVTKESIDKILIDGGYFTKEEIYE